MIRFLILFSVVFTSETQGEFNLYRHYHSAVPSFLPVPTNITVHEGETAQLRCRIENLGPKTVVWRKTDDDFPLTVGERAFTPNKNIEVEPEQISSTESRYNLIIKDVQLDQAGIYECQISAKEVYTFNITLNVLDPIEYKPELHLYGTEFVSILEEIHLICNATGADKAPDAVDWFFNGDVISEGNLSWQDRLVITNRKPLPGRSLISELIIKKARMSDTGHYVCRLTKKLAQGIKVLVLNDSKNHKDPKRDMNPEAADTPESMSSATYHSKAFKVRAKDSCSITLIYILIINIYFR